MLNIIIQKFPSILTPAPNQYLGQFLSPQKTARSSTHPTFTSCMQNDIAMVLFCLSRCRQKTHMYTYYSDEMMKFFDTIKVGLWISLSVKFATTLHAILLVCDGYQHDFQKKFKMCFENHLFGLITILLTHKQMCE